MPRVKRGTVRRAKRKKLLASSERVLSDQEQALSPGERVGRHGAQVRLRRPQEQEARVPTAVGRPHQCGGARARAHLLAADSRPQGRRQRARSQDAGGHGGRAAGRVCQGRLAGQSRASRRVVNAQCPWFNAQELVIEPRALALRLWALTHVRFLHRSIDYRGDCGRTFATDSKAAVPRRLSRRSERRVPQPQVRKRDRADEDARLALARGPSRSSAVCQRPQNGDRDRRSRKSGRPCLPPVHLPTRLMSPCPRANDSSVTCIR